MLSKVLSYGLNGIVGYEVTVEADLSGGLPSFDIVGLADTSIKEARERVRSAIKNTGFDYPIHRITINLAPADTKKEKPIYDVAIATAILSATGQLPIDSVKDTIFLGELSLDGSVKKINGVLPILISARENGAKKVILPHGNANEASYIKGLEIVSVKKLDELGMYLRGEIVLQPIAEREYETDIQSIKNTNDFKFVKGQQNAKRALEIAAAGGHNVIMIGPPGSGKTMLAKSFSSILPDMTFEEALEVTKIHSVAGKLNETGIVLARPFRTPHHTASKIALTGGGAHAKPGEVSLAHHGVLFLDEMPEYDRATIEALRQPLEDGVITVARANNTYTYPASFTLIGSMNPCPCGNYGSAKNVCRCSPAQIHKYLSKLSGPLMDRIDLHVEVDSINFEDLHSSSLEESSADIKRRVDEARKIQLTRFNKSNIYSNSAMSSSQIKDFCALDKESEDILALAFNNLRLSARANNKILKVARTIADLDGEKDILPRHIAEAIGYRSLDSKYWN